MEPGTEGLISRFSLNDLYKEVIGGCGLKKGDDKFDCQGKDDAGKKINCCPQFE